MKGITPIINEGSGCDYHRIALPMKFLGVETDFQDRPALDVLAQTRVIIFNRVPPTGLDQLLDFRSRFGYKIVCDVDDYWELYSGHPLQQQWKDQEYPRLIVDSMKIADAVFTTTPLLADKVKPYNANVFVIPNGLPFGHEQFNDTRVQHDTPRFMYAGGSTHFWDILELKQAFKRLNNELEDTNYILAGYENTPTWNKIDVAFSLNGKLKNYSRQWSLPLDKYMNQYNYADVSLAPLANNMFNWHKSNLKVLEAGCKRIPIITSNVSPYINEPDLNKITVARNTKGWYDNIRYYASNPIAAKVDGYELGEYVRANYDLLKINEMRRQIFERLSE